MGTAADLRIAGRVAFTYPDFVRYELARFFIVLALEMQSVAVGWQVYDITKRPLDLGLIGLAQFLPGIVLFLPAGHAADRFDRRNLLTICYLGFALASALLLAPCAAMFSTLQIHPKCRPPAREPVEWDTVLAGFQYVWRQKVVLGSISLDMFAVLLGGAVALLPVYAREILHTGPWALGLLRSAPGVGAGIMAILLAHRPLRRRMGAIMLWCVAGFGVFTIVFGISRSLTLSMIALLLTGATDMVSVVIRALLVQLATPDEMRGRVNAVDMLFIGASNELGEFESGLTAHWFGTVPAVVLGGVGTLVVIALWAWLFPELRRADKLV